MSKRDIARDTWTGKLDFILSCIGFSVGLGNIWRFPYLAYRNGGGAFLIPYVIMLAIAGLPLYFFELALGQFASEGPITVWKVAPIFYGIGWGMVAISAMVCIYYNVIIMYAVYYMFVSLVNLDREVPWTYCNNTWNTPNCRFEPYPDFESITNNTKKIMEKEMMMDEECVRRTFADISSTLGAAVSTIYDLDFSVISKNFSNCDLKLVTPSEEYWTRVVLRLQEADGMEDVGDISLKNVLFLLFTWIVIFFCLMKGIKSSGRVVYFTATFPYVILIVLLVRGVTLPGYYKGIEFYIIPKWEELKDPKVWSDAATQIFYSLGAGFGGILTMASYNKFRKNCFRDAMVVALINCSTSVFAGFAIFSVLGFMAHHTNQAVDDVADSGPGLVFVAYPEGIARLPVSSLWGFLFFFMIFIVGLDSQFAMMETVISGFVDLFPRMLTRKKTLFTFTLCILGFVLGIPQTTKGGIYVLTLFDWYCATYNLMMVAFFELIALAWVYGIKNFIDDIEMMIGKKPLVFWAYWIGAWVFITPAAILFILIMSAINSSPASYGGYEFPTWAQWIGWIMVIIPLLLILIGAVVQVIRKGGNVRAAIAPDELWGPRLNENRKLRDRYNDGRGYDNPAYEMEDGKVPQPSGYGVKYPISDHL